MKPKLVRHRSRKNFDNFQFRSALINNLLWRHSTWKLDDLMNSTLNHMTKKIPLKSGYVRAD